MRVDAEVLGIQWAQKGDPRITRSGALLRQLRIDGDPVHFAACVLMPQLWGVLRGDLSLIGPRPERPELELESGASHSSLPRSSLDSPRT